MDNFTEETADIVNIELIKKDRRGRTEYHILYSYPRADAEALYINALVDYIRVTSDSEFRSSYVGAAPPPASQGTFVYDSGAKSLALNIPPNTEESISVTLNGSPVVDTNPDVNTIEFNDGTYDVTVNTPARPAVKFTITFETSPGVGFIFDSDAGTITPIS